jgi:hypothetical protein
MVRNWRIPLILCVLVAGLGLLAGGTAAVLHVRAHRQGHPAKRTVLSDAAYQDQTAAGGQAGRRSGPKHPAHTPSSAAPAPTVTIMSGTAVDTAPDPQPTISIAPAPQPAPSSGGQCGWTGGMPQSQFVQTCGTGFQLNGQPFVIRGATAYGQYDNGTQEAALAVQAKLNTLEIVEFETRYHDLSDTMSTATWQRVDSFIAAAQAAGLHVILNLSSYGKSLQAAGQKPTNADWQPYLSFVANRINSKTGARYADDPTIAMVELYGEIDASNYNAPYRGTTAETNAFYKRTLAQWKALDPHHLVSTGGFSYLNDQNSGIDWKTIMSDTNNDACAVEVNSAGDRDVAIPNVSAYCKKMGKPLFVAAWSACYRPVQYSDDISSWQTDAAMAGHAQAMYNIPAAGSDFWNLAAVPSAYGTCDIGPQFPQTLAIVQANAH